MTLAYMASPYTRYSRGIGAAFVDAAKLAARLIQAGVNVYSPIVHSHPIAECGDIDPRDQKFWHDFNQTMLAKCDVLIVAHMDGWEDSSGVAHEIAFFAAEGKPIFDLDPMTLGMVRRSMV